MKTSRSRFRQHRVALFAATVALLGLWVPLRMAAGASVRRQAVPAAPARQEPRGQTGADREASALLETLERKAFDYFWRETPPETELVKDRARNAGPDTYTVASLAATGFGLAALPVGVERGWISRAQGEERARQTLTFVRDRLANEHGWLYHFVDARSGERVWSCELSSIDTGLFLAGAILAGRYFRGTPVARVADQLYRRVDFTWMLTDGGAKPREQRLSMGWTPEKGFLASRWGSYDELMILYLLGLGSPAHPLPAASWDAWARPEVSYQGYRGVALDLPLFVHQFSHAFVDFHGKKDRRGFDPWQNSVTATRMNRDFCLAHAGRFPGYSARSWGLSACDGPDGYRAYAPAEGQHDGTVAPWAVAASVPFAPELCLPALTAMRQDHGDRLWGRYGFADSYNLGRNWFDPDVIGIDLGAALLMIENHRSGLIWKQFMAIPAIRTAMQRAGFAAAAGQNRMPSPRTRPLVARARRPV
jgi:hypothetical protein